VGDAHLHFPRVTPEDDEVIFDLMDAEDLRYGCNLAYNEPAGPYAGLMAKMAAPQEVGVGEKTLRTRGVASILSGQEYRSGIYGHLNLYLRDDLAFPGKAFNADHWPVQGLVARETMDRGGFAIHAHGGYAAEVYADAALGNVNAVELLQFGVYRGIGLEGWYDMLNAGYRFPAMGSCDFPPCRTLADCRTYVHQAAAMREWLAGIAEGRSFFTTGPLLLLEVDGAKPGAQVAKTGDGPHPVKARVRMRCEVTPVTHLDLIVNGQVMKHETIPADAAQGKWVDVTYELALTESSWVAARAYSQTSFGQPDAEAHTNPVYVYLNNRAPFQRASLDAWVSKIDGLIAKQSAREFAERAQVLGYFQSARDVLMRIREQNGLKADADIRQFNAQAAVEVPEDLKAFLTPVPSKTPEEALKSFETLPGFHMELVAAEPLVRSPIAGAFDEDGQLYIAEMRDYPYNGNKPVRVAKPNPHPDEPLQGAVRLLRDTNGDGVFDESHVFADGLLWPAGIAPWKGGVFVSAPPHIWYMKDTDGDFQADVKEPVFTGFGAQNQQAMVNNLIWGLDHRIYASTAGNGGEITGSNGASLSVNGHDFSFDPVTKNLRLESGTMQFGHSFDDEGNRFLCSQGEACAQVVLPRRYLDRVPEFSAGNGIKNLVPSPTPIHRISPIEKWRHIRSSRRVTEGIRGAGSSGVSHHVIDAGSGITIYRGGVYPPGFWGNAFVADGQNNLVHRRLLKREGTTFVSQRADEGTEFVRSPDIWFRPVNFMNAPDGTLYCIDMSREYLETINIPPDVEEHLNLTSGRDQGRIYRIAPDGFKSSPPPRLSQATSAELVAALEHRNGWWRETAQRLLFERQDVSVRTQLERMAMGSDLVAGRVGAMWALQGMNLPVDGVVGFMLKYEAPEVRANALRLAEPMLDSNDGLWEMVLKRTNNTDVRLQAAFTIGESKRNRVDALAKLAIGADEWMQAAVISSIGNQGAELFGKVSGEAVFAAKLVTVIGAQNRPEDTALVLTALAARPDAFALVNAYGEGLKRAGTTLRAVDTEGRLNAMLDRAPAVANDAAQPESLRKAALEALAHHPYAAASTPLLAQLDPKQPAALQLAALQTLSTFQDPALAAALLERLPSASLEIRARALDVILQRPERIGALFAALEAKTLRPADLSASQLAALRQHRDETIRHRAGELLGATSNTARQDVYKSFLPALSLPGDAARGRVQFETRCAACHQFGGAGYAFGPDLHAARTGGKEKLLTSIVDPNREVMPQFTAYTLSTVRGEMLPGIVKGENAAQVTLLLPGGVERVVPRAEIASLKTMGLSIMPDGLETGMTPQDMADLIAFILE